MLFSTDPQAPVRRVLPIGMRHLPAEALATLKDAAQIAAIMSHHVAKSLESRTPTVGLIRAKVLKVFSYGGYVYAGFAYIIAIDASVLEAMARASQERRFTGVPV